MSAPILVLGKSAAYISEEMIIDVQGFCWEMILDNNKEIAVSSGMPMCKDGSF